MTKELWTAVDEYITDLMVPRDAKVQAALKTSAEAGLPSLSVSAPQGAFLMILAKSIGAKSILEIGTLGGYSTMWLAKALGPGGKLTTLEVDPNHADVAKSNFYAAGLTALIDLRLGKALDTLPVLAGELTQAFDFVFIDADKQSIPEYFEWALKLTRRGGLILVDNVVRSGDVVDANSTDPRVQGVRRFNELVAKDKRATATTIQTVGSKGHDGFALILVG